MYKIEEKCTPTRVDENKRLKLFSAFQMMHDCDDLWIDSEPYAKEIFEKEHRAQLLAARQGEELTPLVYVDDNKYYIELKCERGTCAVIAFE